MKDSATAPRPRSRPNTLQPSRNRGILSQPCRNETQGGSVGCFEGNHAETRTIIPIVKQFAARHGIEGTELVIAADAGMLSAANLTALDDAGLKFIVGSRQTKAPKDLASHFRWHGNHFTDGQIVDTVTPVHGNTRSSPG